MGVSKNLVVSIDEDVVGGDQCVLHLKTTNANNIVLECSVPKVSIRLEDLERAVFELRRFFLDQKTIDVLAESAPVAETNQLSFEYGDDE